jgi:tetratricopeptide (TPR) repeat protein
MLKTTLAIGLALFAALPVRADTLADCRDMATPAKAVVACSALVKEAGTDIKKVGEAYAARAAANVAARDYRAALSDYSSAIIRDAKNPELWHRRGLVRMKVTPPQPIRATADQTLALRYDPKHLAALIERGDLHRQLGLLPKAIADATAALAIDPKSAAAYANRGYAQLRSNQVDKALADADDALKLDAKSIFGLLTRALVAEKKGDKAKAIEDLKRVIELDPERVIARDALKRLGA